MVFEIYFSEFPLPKIRISACLIRKEVIVVGRRGFVEAVSILKIHYLIVLFVVFQLTNYICTTDTG